MAEKDNECVVSLEGGREGREGRGGEGGREEGRKGGEGRDERDDCYTYYNGTTIFKYQSCHVLRNNVSRHSIGSTPNNGT